MSQEWQTSSKNENNVIGNWLSKDNVSIAAFVQCGQPACTIYVDDKSRAFLTLNENGLVIQYQDENREFHFFSLDDMTKLAKLKKLFSKG